MFLPNIIMLWFRQTWWEPYKFAVLVHIWRDMMHNRSWCSIVCPWYAVLHHTLSKQAVNVLQIVGSASIPGTTGNSLWRVIFLVEDKQITPVVITVKGMHSYLHLWLKLGFVKNKNFAQSIAHYTGAKIIFNRNFVFTNIFLTKLFVR